jgi:hypothetical protein
MGKNETSRAREDDNRYKAVMDISHQLTSDLYG